MIRDGARIGLLVDDAIVVVENVERLMAEEGLSPLEATRKSMDQITGALVGIGLVLSAVFIPMAFLDGATGFIYRQFSATIVASMALSVLVAVILTPALCATMLKPIPKGHHAKETGFFGWFNRKFDQGNSGYQKAVRGILSRRMRFMGARARQLDGLRLLFEGHPRAGPEALTAARDQFLGEAAQSKLLANVRPNGQEDTPQFRIDIDAARAGAFGLSSADINAALSTAWGGQYIDDFIDRGRVKTSTAGRCATAKARWFRSAASPARVGALARRGSSATTACPRWRSTASGRPASARVTR